MNKNISLLSLVMVILLGTGCTQGQQNVGHGDKLDGEAKAGKTIDGTESNADSKVASKKDEYVAKSFSYYDTTVDLKDGTKGTLQQIFFAFDKFSLSEDMLNQVKENKVVFSGIDSKIKLEGNCDEWGTDEYNYALGLKRAKTVKDALVAEGIDSTRIVLVSLGESNPLCTSKLQECLKLNRRVENKLLP